MTQIEAPHHVFARNLDHLLRLRKLSRRAASESAEVPYKWLRRVVTEGLARSDRRNRPHLERIARSFGLGSPDDLWRDDLISVHVAEDRPAVRSALSRRSKRQVCLDQFSELLASGRHNYLYEVIDGLHAREMRVRSGDDIDQRQPGLPLIKWQGSKRRQAAQIVEQFPTTIRTYHEPFVGGGAVLYELLASGIKVRALECGDTCAPLIALWKLVKADPQTVQSEYERMWLTLRARGERFYYEVRKSFNRQPDPCKLFFLLRTCRLGHVRFNMQGHFTSAFQHKGRGVAPQKLHGILEDWHGRLTSADVRFAVRDYAEVSSKAGDLLYLDPPYFTSERYYGRIDFAVFVRWLGRQRGSYVLSLSGFVGGDDRTVAVPETLYDEHLQLDAGVNPFARLSGRESPMVTDSLYVRRRPPR